MAKAFTPTEIGELFGAHGATLEHYAAEWTCLGADCVQEAFIALAKLDDRPDRPIAWLYSVVRNKAQNALRSAKRRANHERLASLLIESSPTRLLDRQLEKAELEKALNELSDYQRELVVLRIWSQMKWHDIAEVTETSKSKAQRNYVAALQRLKEILDPCPNRSNCQTN